jgi:hypothetical protein
VVNRFELLEQIREVRAANNDNWLELVKIALTHAEQETVQVLKNINKNDSEIGRLMRELGGDDEDTGSGDCDGP